jgi:hypothetical protein
MLLLPWLAAARAASGAPADDRLGELYKNRMRTYLGYEAFRSYDRPVRNSRQAELYKLIYAPKIQVGSELWDRVNKDEPDGQISLIV